MMIIEKNVSTGPSFTHLHEAPHRSHFVGTSSPKNVPLHYFSCLEDLYRVYETEVRFSHEKSKSLLWLDEDEDAGIESNKGKAKRKDLIPLIINTQGWVKGLGAELLEKIHTLMKPTIVASFKDSRPQTELIQHSNKTSSKSGLKIDRSGIDWMFKGLRTEIDSQTQAQVVFNLRPVGMTTLSSRWSPAELRVLSLVSYFHHQHFLKKWDFETSMVRWIPYKVNWEVLNSIRVLGDLGGEVDKQNALIALNGTIVGLVEGDLDLNDGKVEGSFNYSTLAPSPNCSNYLGLGILRSIDVNARIFYIISPLDIETISRCRNIVKGDMILPICLMLDRELVDGKSGVELPYLEVENKRKRYIVGEGKKKVRRNLMRKSQFRG
jgi:polynucleotide 5'-hydroxyl-kinase GRC3/NOL9